MQQTFLEKFLKKTKDSYARGTYAFHNWLRDRFHRNLPYDEIVRDVLAATIDEVRSSTVGTQLFGAASCVGSNGPPAISSTGTPRLGQSYRINLANGASSGLATLTIGGSNESVGGAPLPFPLQVIGAGPGCMLYTSMELTVPATTDPGGRAGVTIPLPVNSLLLGGSIYHTWLAIDPGAPQNPLSIVTTQGLEAVPGG